MYTPKHISSIVATSWSCVFTCINLCGGGKYLVINKLSYYAVTSNKMPLVLLCACSSGNGREGVLWCVPFRSDTHFFYDN